MRKNTGKLLRLNATLLGGTSQECLICLDVRFLRCLLSLSERLEWAATWVDENGKRVELVDQEWQIIEQGIGNLMDCINVEDLSGQLERLESAIQALEELQMQINVSSGCGCGCSCGGSTQPVDPPEGTGDTPPVIPSDDLPGTESYLFYKCRLANYLADSLITCAVNLKNYWSTGSVTADGITIIISNIPALRPLWIIVLQVAAYMGGIFNSGLFDNIIAVLTVHRDDIVCALYQGESPADAKNAAESVIMSATEYPYVSRLIAWFFLQFVPFESSFAEGAVAIPALYNDATCCEVDEPPAPGVCWMPAGYTSLSAAWLIDLPSGLTDVQEEDASNNIATDCGFQSKFIGVFAFNENDQTYAIHLNAGNTDPTNVIGFYLEILQNDCPGGNDPGGNLARISYDRNGDGNAETPIVAAPYYRAIVVRQAYLSDFASLGNEVIVVADSETWGAGGGTQFKVYRRCGVSCNPEPFGNYNTIEFRVGWIRNTP